MSAEVIQLFPKPAEANNTALERQFLEAAMEWAEPYVRHHLDMRIIKNCDLKLFGLLVKDIIAIKSGQDFTIQDKRSFLHRLDYLLVLQERAATGKQTSRSKSSKKKDR